MWVHVREVFISNTHQKTVMKPINVKKTIGETEKRKFEGLEAGWLAGQLAIQPASQPTSQPANLHIAFSSFYNSFLNIVLFYFRFSIFPVIFK